MNNVRLPRWIDDGRVYSRGGTEDVVKSTVKVGVCRSTAGKNWAGSGLKKQKEEVKDKQKKDILK